VLERSDEARVLFGLKSGYLQIEIGWRHRVPKCFRHGTVPGNGRGRQGRRGRRSGIGIHWDTGSLAYRCYSCGDILVSGYALVSGHALVSGYDAKADIPAPERQPNGHSGRKPEEQAPERLRSFVGSPQRALNLSVYTW